MLRALQPGPVPSHKLLLRWHWVFGKNIPTGSPVNWYQELLLEILEFSCFLEQSIETENPPYRTTCHVVFPEASFHFLNDLIDEPFLFIHPHSAGFHSNNQTWNPELGVLSE